MSFMNDSWQMKAVLGESQQWRFYYLVNWYKGENDSFPYEILSNKRVHSPTTNLIIHRKPYFMERERERMVRFTNLNQKIWNVSHARVRKSHQHILHYICFLNKKKIDISDGKNQLRHTYFLFQRNYLELSASVNICYNWSIRGLVLTRFPVHCAKRYLHTSRVKFKL
jgi:hypothetical protein